MKSFLFLFLIVKHESEKHHAPVEGNMRGFLITLKT
jgi:hypothetical protein